MSCQLVGIRGWKSDSRVLPWLALAVTFTACKKEPPPAPPPPPAPVAAVPAAPPPAPKPALPEIACPPAETFAAFLEEPPPAVPGKPGAKKPAKAAKSGGKGRAWRSSCIVFAPGRFWTAAVLSFEEKTRKDPRIGLVSGSPNGKAMIFDVVPLPTAAIEKLLSESAEIGVQIRKTREDESLLRIGVTGGPGGGKPDKREFGLLLQLVAHHPPQMLWVGPGDEVVSEPNGCVTEQRIEFELLFRTRLERLTVAAALPDSSGKVPPQCAGGGPSTQETVAYKPLPLPSGRYFAEAANADKPKRTPRPE
ncbi:MAG TPA: hypothetical protein VGG33_27950 [Polyangia bacterium]